MKKICDALGQSPLFAGLDHQAFNRFCVRVNMRLAWKGEVLANEGDDCTSLGVVVSGQLALQKYASSGDYVTLDLLGPGDVYGEDLIFGHNRVYPLTIEAVTNAKVLVFPRDTLLALLKEQPQLMENFVGFLSDKVQKQNRRINILSQRNLRQKIATYLLDLNRQQSADEDAVRKPEQKVYVSTSSVELPVSKEVAARLLAMPRPSFSRELVRMEKDGLIKVSGRVIWLTDMDGLEGGDSDEDDLD
ncbi:Crp/Fnr family transcriptional regulator [Oscillospiraceae bacterium HV4-5-C5C]|nr:Crp/Fnr family transcriptional regulator [Oscillospiraceae bacterium HV4-5-C5C]